jgi:hypothetical protein
MLALSCAMMSVAIVARGADEMKNLAEPQPREWVDTGTAWHDMLNDSVVFGVQADLHSDRVLEDYMKRVYADMPKVGADFMALCGDVVGFHNGLRESANARRPVLFGFGDHECFEEWGYIWCDENLPYAKTPVLVPPARRRTGTVGWHQEHQFNMMLTELSPTQAWSGMPYWWSMNYKGIHFVVIGGFKCQPVPSFLLAWFKQDLAENKDKTTVILTHRIVFEKGNKWDNVGKWNEVVAANPQVKLVLYGHYHYAAEPREKPFDRIGSALALAAELVPGMPAGRTPDDEMHEMGAYALASVAKDGIRIYNRYFDQPGRDGGALLVVHESFASTYDPGAATTFSLPYVMTEHGKHYAPAVQMKDATLRIWGVEREQMLPNPVFAEAGMPFTAGDGATLAPAVVPNQLGIPKMLGIKVEKAKGTPEAPAILASITMDLAEKGKAECWNSGTGQWDMGEYGYFTLAVATGQEGRHVWVVVEPLLPDGSVEATYVRKMTMSGEKNLHYIYQELGAIWQRSVKSWIWSPGPKGQENNWLADKQPSTRMSTKLRISVATPDEISAPETLFASVFVYTTEAFYTVPTYGRSDENPSGRDWSRDVLVKLGGKVYGEGKALADGQFVSCDVGELLGGTEFEVESCRGSKVVMVELKGRADALMVHQIRKITKDANGSLVAGPICEGSDSNNPAKGITRIDFFGEGILNGKEVGPKVNGSHADLADGATIAFPR